MSANLSGCFMKKMSAIGKNERRRIILRHTYFFQFLGGRTLFSLDHGVKGVSNLCRQAIWQASEDPFFFTLP